MLARLFLSTVITVPVAACLIWHDDSVRVGDSAEIAGRMSGHVFPVFILAAVVTSIVLVPVLGRLIRGKWSWADWR